MSNLSHAGLAGYLLRSQLQAGAPRPDGAVALVFDGSLRVLLHPAPRGDLVLESRICALPPGQARVDELLERCARAAALRSADDPDCLAIDAAGEALLLQQRIAADASADDFEAGLAHFLDAVVGWRAEAGSL